MQEIERVEEYADLDYYPRKVEMSAKSWMSVVRHVLISDRDSIVEFAGSYNLGEYLDSPKRVLVERFSDIWHQIYGAKRDGLSYWVEIMPHEHEVIREVAIENSQFGQSDEFAEYEQYYNSQSRTIERIRQETIRSKKNGW